MQNTPVSNRAAFEQRSAQMEQLLRRAFVVFGRIPLRSWQWAIAALLVLSLSHSLARLFWLVMPAPSIPPASITLVTGNNPSSEGSAGTVDVARLKGLAPFGRVVVQEVAPVEVQPVAEEATLTQLNLTLRGVMNANDEASSRAVIASGSTEKLYAIGDTLPVGNNVTLAKVFPLRVILNNNGKFESLSLYKEDPNAPQIGVSYNAPASAPMAQAPVGWGVESGYQQGPGPQARPSANNSEVRNAMGGDPAMAQMSKTLSDVVAMSIEREAGQVIGYKIRPGRNVEMFNSLGLQAGDIVTAVNGVPLSSPGKIMEIYKSMGSATSANLEIKRGGSTVNLDVVLN